MRYLCLVYCEDAAGTSLEGRLEPSGRSLAGGCVGDADTVTTVRFRAGRMDVRDGPAERSAGHLAAFHLIEARDLNEAIQVAARLPGADCGCVDVRPLRPYDGEPARSA